MKKISESLLAALEQQLTTIKTAEDKSVTYAEKAITATIKTSEDLKTAFLKHSFNTKEEEIEFFKHLKPKIVSKLIYYNEIFNIEISKPSGANKTIKKHYEKQQSKLKNFFNANKEFYKYYRSQNTCLDKKYFLRRKHDIR